VDTDAFLNQLLTRFLADIEAGGLAPLETYQRTFPGREEFVAAEYARLCSSIAEEAPDSCSTEGEGTRIGRYRVLSEIGRGGQGRVCLARDERLQRQVAIKILTSLSAFSSELRERFLREAQVASRLDHAGICTVYGTGEEDGVPYIVMGYVPGETLAAKIARAAGSAEGASCVRLGPEPGASPPGGPAPSGSSPTSSSVQRRDLAEIAELFERAARALHAAHVAGVVHRDIKPSNIMIRPDGQPVLLDFGLAVDLEGEQPTLTRTGDVFGTPAYMSPEQISPDRGRPDRRTDVYSLGVSLYECLTLEHPFEAPTRESLYHAILREEPLDPRRRNRAVPRDLAVIVRTTLDKDPDRRYATAEDLAEDLRRLRERQPIRARPPSLAYRAMRFAARNRAFLASAAVLILGLAIATAVVSVDLVRTRRAEAEARDQAESARLTLAFFERMLASVRPDLEGKDARVEPVLDKAALEITKELADRPEIAAHIQNVIATSYQALGLYEKAEVQFRRALTTRREVFDEPREELLMSLNNLAVLLDKAGAPDESIALQREAVDLAANVLDETDGGLAALTSNLAYALMRLDRLDEAEVVFRRAVDLFQKSLGLDHEEAVGCLSGLGITLRRLNRLDEAEAVYLEALAIQERTGRYETYFTTTLNHNLGMLYRSAQRYDEAEVSFRATLEGRRELLKENHPETLMTMDALGSLLRTLKRYEEAEELLVEAVEGFRSRIGEDRPDTLIAMANLGRLWIARGEHEKAREILQRVVDGNLRVFGPDHRETLAARGSLGECLIDLGDYERAEDLLRAALDGLSPRGPGDTDVLRNRHELARLFVERGDVEEGLAMLERLVEDELAALGPDHAITRETVAYLARVRGDD